MVGTKVSSPELNFVAENLYPSINICLYGSSNSEMLLIPTTNTSFMSWSYWALSLSLLGFDIFLLPLLFVFGPQLLCSLEVNTKPL